ncbi:MAG: PilZ domain-containing protein, partial [Nanoarchaeota archaeon]|nr:PilZ domain-containing protein [Nanoarchaeota archaeon]
ESVSEFIRQRLRWARGTLQSLFASTNPLSISGLSPAQRIINSYGVIYYLTFPLYLFFAAMPLLYFFFGIVPMITTMRQLMFFFFPFLLLNLVVFSWLCKRWTLRLASFVFEFFMCFPLTVTVLRTLLNPFGENFKVTQKGLFRNKIKFNCVPGIFLIVGIAINVFALVYGYKNMFWYGSNDIYYTFFIWTGLVIIIPMWLGIQGSMDLPQERAGERFEYTLDCFIHSGQRVFAGTIVNISDLGVLINSRFFSVMEKVAKNEERIDLQIPALDIKGLHMNSVRPVGPQSLAFKFINPSNEQYRKLVEFLYCRQGQWEKRMISDRTFWKTIWQSLWRVYPGEQVRQPEIVT